MIISLKLAHLRENYIFLREPKKICLKFAKSGQLIHICFNSVCFLGKMAELENGLKTVKINFMRKKSCLKYSPKIKLQIYCNMKSL